MTEKKRLDTALFERGFSESREKAKALIMAGQVYVNNQKVTKSGETVKEGDCLEVRGDKLPFVSRGGLKLQKALEQFPLDLSGCVCMDIGASTGGFSDCMLQHGATKVYAIDVGYGQLAWKLRADPRVVNLERTNFRYVTREQIPEAIDFASVDVSFISLRLIVPVMRDLLRSGGKAVCLIKPQFEAGRDKVGKKGVVREQSVHIEVVEGIVAFLLETGFSVLGLDYSPVKGPQGNIEYLVLVEKTDAPQNGLAVTAKDVVTRSHEALDK
ncbi:MAG: TlyA family RNA methyltransferase [Clostridia bacterium]|jgi:23S rRNA (cytidine1920-2'-O)/16S rRNA (cytidine1409-2'-O)-methyltransferase|nr:TlyA family RNA methyltransferase [Clostridia bacterium]MBQ6092508.1 TlyA family RNA methyltransferase [Clostridia bacterium]MBR3095573.1 TlyA family RNA methyltransferase [Clostridia bacterium]